MNSFRRTLPVLALAIGVGVALAGASRIEWDGVTGPDPPQLQALESPAVEPSGTIALLTDPSVIPGATVTIDFDDAAHHDPVNIRYEDFGIRFSRDDGCCIHAYHVCSCGYKTSSPPMMACTTRGPGSPYIGNHIIMEFDRDVHVLGLTVGNDRSTSMIFTVELFDAAGDPVGTVWYTPNGNNDADDWIGVSSLVAFREARVSHTWYGVAMCVDDVSFSTRALITRGTR